MVDSLRSGDEESTRDSAVCQSLDGGDIPTS